MPRTQVALSPSQVLQMDADALARLAACGTPRDANDAGADLLDTVRHDVIEAFEWLTDDGNGGHDYSAVFRESRIVDTFYSNGGVSVDSREAVMWAAFVELHAYRETPDGMEHAHGFEQMATLALCEIGERLARALAAGLAEWAMDQELGQGE
jgi:hypothetical protein